jgi:hypothetical protein
MAGPGPAPPPGQLERLHALAASRAGRRAGPVPVLTVLRQPTSFACQSDRAGRGGSLPASRTGTQSRGHGGPARCTGGRTAARGQASGRSNHWPRATRSQSQVKMLC